MRKTHGPELSADAERRPPRTEADRSEIARRYSSHLPEAGQVYFTEEDDMAVKAAFIRRFDEDLPRTETLMAVAHIGYRMALRDLSSGRGLADATQKIPPQEG
jgi:hypothetical protein